MQEYTYTDFMNTLNDTEKRVADVVYDHIANHYFVALINPAVAMVEIPLVHFSRIISFSRWMY